MTALEGLPAVLSLGPEGMAVEFGATLPAAAAPEPLRVSISRARTFRQCPKRGFFEYELGRRPSNAPHEQVWGAALHRGLEIWFEMMRASQKPETALAWAIDAALDPRGVDKEGRPYAPPADPYAGAALRAMLRAYAAVWGASDAERYEVVAVELPFDLPVVTATGRESRGRGGASARRVGRVDLVVRERPPVNDDGIALDGVTGALWITEHKTTGKPPGDDVYYRGIEVDPQIATYHDALTILGYAPAGVLYDVVRRPDYHEPKPAPAMKRCPDCKGSGGREDPEVPASQTRCLGCQGSGKIPRAARTVECEACEGIGAAPPSTEPPAGLEEGGTWTEPAIKCQVCHGAGRVTPTVSYSNPRHGERAADYEERIFRLATGADETTEAGVLRRRSEWFGRREFRAGEGPLTSARIQEARLQLWSAAREIRAYQRAGVWPEVGDRYVCAPPGRRPVCPWLDVCAGRARADDDRLYPLKVRGMVTEGDE